MALEILLALVLAQADSFICLGLDLLTSRLQKIPFACSLCQSWILSSMATANATTTAAANSTNVVSPQGGILEGGNPTHYDSKNPLVLFIIQVIMAPSEKAETKLTSRPS